MPNAHSAPAAVTDASVAHETSGQARYLNVAVDRVVIDTGGLTTASASLAASIDRLALAIEKLSTDSADLGPAEKEVMLDATRLMQIVRAITGSASLTWA